MSTYLYSVKATVIFSGTVILTLGNGALNALVRFVFAVIHIHNLIPLRDNILKLCASKIMITTKRIYYSLSLKLSLLDTITFLS